MRRIQRRSGDRAVIVGRTQNERRLLCLRQNRRLFLLCALLVGGWTPCVFAGGWGDFWFSPEQQGQRLFDEGRYLDAAGVFTSPERMGVAYFRGGDFESAASVFGRIRSPEAAYNRGNSLVMLGRYDEAIEAYESALEARPGWAEAEQNLVVAIARKEQLTPPDSDEGGTGGMLEADELVFDDTGRVDKGGTETVSDEEEGISDDEMRAVWLRRVQNDPAEFLRARFSYQLYRDEQAQTEGSDAPQGD